MAVEIYASDKEMTLNLCTWKERGWSLSKYLEILLLFIKCSLTLAIISFCDILISALHGKRKESFIFLTLLFKSHSFAVLDISLYK